MFTVTKVKMPVCLQVKVIALYRAEATNIFSSFKVSLWSFFFTLYDWVLK